MRTLKGLESLNSLNLPSRSPADTLPAAREPKPQAAWKMSRLFLGLCGLWAICRDTHSFAPRLGCVKELRLRVGAVKVS